MSDGHMLASKLPRCESGMCVRGSAAAAYCACCGVAEYTHAIAHIPIICCILCILCVHLRTPLYYWNMLNTLVNFAQ